MRTSFLAVLALSIAVLASAQEPKASPTLRYRMELVYIFETEKPSLTTESIIVIGNSGFKSLAALKQFVAALQRGAVLEWAPGCERLGGELLLSSAKEMEDFRVFCRKRGIAFILHPSG